MGYTRKRRKAKQDLNKGSVGPRASNPDIRSLYSLLGRCAIPGSGSCNLDFPCAACVACPRLLGQMGTASAELAAAYGCPRLQPSQRP